jgi:hypothetical protein
MTNQEQRTPENGKGLEMFLVFVAFVLAWPALLLGVVIRWQIKQRTTDPFPYWLGAGVVGACGAIVLITQVNPSPFFFPVMNDITPLVFHMGMSTLKQFALDALPLWERSILVFPWFSLLLELFGPKNLQASLLAKERHRQALQIRKSQRAARRAAKAPDQINGHAILGALIDDPNH